MGSITIVGVGFSEEQLTLGAVRALESGAQVILHTAQCGVSEYLDKKGIAYTSLDDLYEQFEDFDEHAEAAANAVAKSAKKADVVYCVMDVRDSSASLLAADGAAVIPGPSAEGMLMAFAEGAVQLFFASDWENMRPDAGMCAIVREIDNHELACEVKLRLMEAYPDDAETVVLTPDGRIKRIELYDLDRQEQYDHRFSALIMAEKDPAKRNEISMRDLVGIARQFDAVYKEGDAADIADGLARIAGMIAYAEDRGEYNTADMLLDAKDVLQDE